MRDLAYLSPSDCEISRRLQHLHTFSCLDQYLCMAFAQLTYRESLPDIDVCLRAQTIKLFHLGLLGEVSRRATTRCVASARRFCFHHSNDPAPIGASEGEYATGSHQTPGSKSCRAGATSSRTTCSVIGQKEGQVLTPYQPRLTLQARGTAQLFWLVCFHDNVGIPSHRSRMHNGST